MKRLMDIAFSLALIITALPFMILITLIIWLTMGRPVLFKQIRPGLHGHPFVMYKFRTMADRRDQNSNLLPDKDRLTWVGKILRKTSLDELPEFINVLKGDMSLVGPRPLLMEYLPKYSKKEFRRHEVKPGITGLAQINGRNQISWESRFNLDVLYVDTHNPFLDIKILFMTIKQTLFCKGISAHGHATMPRFDQES